MAQRPDGKAARTERVSFTRPAAERIAKVVRQVEAGDRDAGPLSFGYRDAVATSKLFRICTFTGSWSIGSLKTVTFKYQTNTPNTVTATNLFFPVVPGPTSNTDCAIAKEGTAWYLIDVAMRTASASVVTDISISAALNTSDCTITVSKTLSTSSITFLQFKT